MAEPIRPSAEAAKTRRAALLLGAVIVLWGANWPVMKVGLEFIPPLWFAALRVLIGAACLIALLAAMGRFRVPGRDDLPVVVSVGVLQVGFFLGFVTWGLTIVGAGRSSILAYTTPLWVLPMAWVVLGERLDRAKATALAFGLAGLLVLFNPVEFDFAEGRRVFGNALLLCGAVSWAGAMVHVRRHEWRLTPLELMPWQMLIGGGGLAAAALASEPFSAIDWGWPLAWVLIYNGPVASAFCFWAFVTVNRALPAVTTAVASLGVPVAGVVFSTAALGEPLTVGNVGGLTLICAGVAALSLPSGRR